MRQSCDAGGGGYKKSSGEMDKGGFEMDMKGNR
jgi:hypothetical protein